MKKITIIVALLFGFSDLIIAQTFQSKLANGNCKEMTLRYDAHDIYYHLENLSCTDEIHMSIFNQTSIEVTSEGFYNS